MKQPYLTKYLHLLDSGKTIFSMNNLAVKKQRLHITCFSFLSNGFRTSYVLGLLLLLSACQNKNILSETTQLDEIPPTLTVIRAQEEPSISNEGVYLSTYTATAEQKAPTPNTNSITTNTIDAFESPSTLDTTMQDIGIIEIDNVPTISVWDKLRQDFAWVHHQNNERINKEIKRYSKNPNYLPKIAARAQYFLHFIIEELNRRNMPVELALLPIVESAFNPYGVSSSQATGLWQFIRGTGDIYKLTRNEWVDQRRNTIASSIAAIDYLETLINRFNGDVALALAAYNAGPTTVRNAQNANIARGKPSDYWSLKLPKETMDYVPRLIAVSKVVNTPFQYNVELPEIDYEAYFEVIHFDGPVDLEKVAKAYNMDYEHLHFLNSQYFYKVTPQGPQPILLPVEHLKLSDVDSTQTQQFIDNTHISSDKPISLSDLSRYKKVALSLLLQLNPEYLADMKIPKGELIHFPNLTPANDKMAKLIKYSAQSQTRYHIVKKGDTLWNISRRYNVSHKDIAKWNNLKTTSVLSIGKKLKIKQQSLKPKNKHYIVAQGDTLWSVAKRFQVSISDLRQWNNLQDHSLSIGQKLTMVVYQ